MPPTKALAKAFGSSRAAFYRQLLERAKKFVKIEGHKYVDEGTPLEGWQKYNRAPSLKELTDMEGVKSVKNSLRVIDPSVFDDLDAVVPPLSPYNLRAEGMYFPSKNRMKLDYDSVTYDNSGGLTVSHELWHHMQNKLGKLTEQDVTREMLEEEADEFADAVLRRSIGGARGDIPKKFLPYILGLLGAFQLKNGSEDRD